MMDRYFDTSACPVIYKSPKKVRNWFSLREYYRKNREHEINNEDNGPAEPVRLAISVSSGRWEQVKSSFNSLEDAMETIEEFESLGVRVAAFDTSDEGDKE